MAWPCGLRSASQDLPVTKISLYPNIVEVGVSNTLSMLSSFAGSYVHEECLEEDHW